MHRAPGTGSKRGPSGVRGLVTSVFGGEVCGGTGQGDPCEGCKVASALAWHPQDWHGPLRGERVRASTCVGKHYWFAVTSLQWKLESQPYGGNWNRNAILESRCGNWNGIVILETSTIIVDTEWDSIADTEIVSCELESRIVTTGLASRKLKSRGYRGNSHRYLRFSCLSLNYLTNIITVQDEFYIILKLESQQYTPIRKKSSTRLHAVLL